MASDGADVLGSVLGAIVSNVLLYPIQGVEARQRVDASLGKLDTVSAAIAIYQYDGLSGIYAGLSASIVGHAINTVVYFSLWLMYGATLLFIRKQTGAGYISVALMDLFAGLLAGATASLIMNPMWLL